MISQPLNSPPDYATKNALLLNNFSEEAQEEKTAEKYNESLSLFQTAIPLNNPGILRLSCGRKHDQLVELETALAGTSVCIPPFLGFTNDQIQSLLSNQTFELWSEIEKEEAQSSPSWLFRFKLERLLSKIQESVEQDILASALPFTKGQRKKFDKLKEKPLIARSSSNEDGKAINAGGNESVKDVKPNEEDLRAAIARVVKSYFSIKSLKNRSASEGPFSKFPLCSVLVMEQIIENEQDSTPIVSGVMMTSKTAWSAPDEEGITHITSWRITLLEQLQ